MIHASLAKSTAPLMSLGSQWCSTDGTGRRVAAMVRHRMKNREPRRMKKGRMTIILGFCAQRRTTKTIKRAPPICSLTTNAR